FKGNNNYVIVAINSNSGASSINFSMSGATVTSVTPYQTNSSGGLIQEGGVSVSNNSFVYSLQGQSITTFVGTGSSSSGGGAVSIDAGGAASGSWAADEDFSGGTALTYTNTVSTSLLSGTVPPATVLQSQRYGSGSSFTYTMPGFTSGSSHTVTLYFVENYVTGSGQREFNVLLNGTQVLSNYDVYAAAGGQYKAVQKSFTTTANSSGQIVVQFSPGAVQNPMVSGIAIQ
ncbi:MAG: malectin domain-containing carbohydrate-binding protein, partial [Terracidiphilus sp.]